LSALDGVRLGSFDTALGGESRGRAKGETRFELRLKSGGRSYEPPVVTGLHFEGIGRWYRPWLEVRYETSMTAGEETLDLEGTKEEEALFKLLCDLLPPGGHIMVKYPTHKITAQALMFGIPPAATPLGYLMYLGGCRWYKDWYFAEGFMEGEEKLQATKPLDDARAAGNTRRIRAELEAYLDRSPDPGKPEIEEVCRGLARRILEMPGG
jgi:hypothetical protein